MSTNNNLFLVYVNHIGVNSENLSEYEFFFSEDPASVWGEDWNVQSPSACSNTLPDEGTYSMVKRVVTDIPFLCAQENSCFSLQDMMDSIIPCAFENISNYEEYPTPYRIVLQYGMNYDDVVNVLQGREVFFAEGNTHTDIFEK